MADTLNTGESLRPGTELKSSNGYHTLAMQGDGHLVLYSLGVPVWISGTYGQPVDFLAMQGDGNLVIYAPGGQSTWASNTVGDPTSRLVIQDDRNAVIYTSANMPRWSTGTQTPLEFWNKVQTKMSPQLRGALQNDPILAPTIRIGVECGNVVGDPTICVAAMIVTAVIMEFVSGNPAFGPNNDLRVVGGVVSAAAKKAGGDVARAARDTARAAKDVLNDLVEIFCGWKI